MMNTDTRSVRWLGLLLLSFGLCMTAEVHAQKSPPDKDPLQRADNLSKAAAQPQPARSFLTVNNSTVVLDRNGLYAFADPFTGTNGTFPKASGASAVFSQGFVFGGKVKDGQSPEVRVGGSTYFTGLAPGGLQPNGQPEDASDRARFHVWRVDRSWRSNSVVREAAAYRQGLSNPADVGQGPVDNAREQFAYDWNNWPADMGAPYEECGGGSGYQPANPDSVNQGVPCSRLNGDIPGRPGADQTIWVVVNDIGSTSSTDASQSLYGSPAIGMEVQYTIWGYDRPPGDALGNINFINARLIYTGTPDTPEDARIDSMHTVWWVDPDVGTFSNDFAGVDTSLSLGYAYNASASDDSYAQINRAPPAVGYDFLKGPVNAEGDTLGLTSFTYFAAGSEITDPELGSYTGTREWFNLMRGVRPQPPYPATEPFVNPNTGQQTVYTLPGDPVAGTGWIDGQQLPPGDRRIVNTSGPFTMQKGDTVDVVVGEVKALGSSNKTSISVLKFFDQSAQFAFDQDFQLPSPPASPTVTTAELDKQVVLNWGTDQQTVQRTESFTAPPGFEFQGYNVYQLPSRSASLDEGTRIATFDVDDNVRTLLNDVFDAETGAIFERPVQSLPNQGISRTLQVQRDELRDRPLANGVDYYFAVTAFGYLAEDRPVPSKILESTPTRIVARPQPPRPGTRNIPEYGTELNVQREGDGVGTATVTTEIVDPTLVVDANYTVTFSVNQNTGQGVWNLERGGSPVLTNQAFGFRSDRQAVDGVKVNVGIPGPNVPRVGSPPATFLSAEATQDEGDDLHLWGDATLFGVPAGYYSVFNPNMEAPTIEEARQDLEFRFTGNGGMESSTTEGGQLATYYERAAFGSTQPDTLEHNTIRMPFELWETETNTQINYAVIGRNADGNSPWGNGAAPADGGYYRMAARDYIVPIHTEYDQQTVQSEGTSPAAEEASWLLFFEQGGDSVWETGDVYKVVFPNPLVPGEDMWTFSTEGAETGVQEDLEESVENIGVFPNPYRGFNRLEDSRFDKFVRFTHLPDPAEHGPSTIRIFTLAGNPVRVLRHTEDSPRSQFEDWDLKNEAGVWVSSGLYLVHINTPFGDKVLKLALVMEEEILRRY